MLERRLVEAKKKYFTKMMTTTIMIMMVTTKKKKNFYYIQNACPAYVIKPCAAKVNESFKNQMVDNVNGGRNTYVLQVSYTTSNSFKVRYIHAMASKHNSNKKMHLDFKHDLCRLLTVFIHTDFGEFQ